MVGAHPHRLVALGGRWYLLAYDLARHDWRSFRLDRLTRPRSTGAGFRQRPLPGGDAAAFVRASARAPTAHTVVASVRAPADRVRRVVGQWGRGEPAGPDRCRLALVSTSLAWPAQALGNVGAEFDVVEPPEFVDRLRDWGRRFLDASGRSAEPAGEKP